MTTAEELRGLLAEVESAQAPYTMVDAAGLANDYAASIWPTESWEWTLLVKALSGGLEAAGAAIALVERVLPGWTRRLDESSTDQGVTWSAMVASEPSYVWSAQRESPALALIAALLRAKIAEMESETT